jgi:hypothetical protein
MIDLGRRLMRSLIVSIIAFGVACGGASTTSTQPPVPSAPTGLLATGGNGEIALTWTPVSDATNYLVLRSDQSGGAKTQIGATAVPSFVDGGLPSGRTGFYVVRAVGPEARAPTLPKSAQPAPWNQRRRTWAPRAASARSR